MVNTMDPATNGHLTHRDRARMLRETLYHVEAINKTQWQLPPIQPGEHLSSYADMILDPTISRAIAIVKDSILANGYEIEPAQDAGKGGAAMAIEISNNLLDLDIESALDDALNALWRGFQPQEIVWSHHHKAFRLHELAAISPEQIALELDDHMRVTATISRPYIHTPAQRVPSEKLWMHRNKPSRTKPAGESLLDAAYRSYSSKNRLLQFWGLSIQRFGTPQWEVTIPASTPPSRQTEILTTFSAGRLDGVYMRPEDVAATIINPTQWANQLFENAIDYHDSQMMAAILLVQPPAQGIQRVAGTALAELDRATAYRLARISRALCSSFNTQVIQPLCLANWGAQPAACPRLCLAAPDPARIVAMAAPLATLITAGICDAEEAAEQLGLPEPPAAPPQEPTTPRGPHQRSSR